MGLEVGTITTGKVTGIKKFGAFVTLEERRSGLVHISEVSNTYVEDITTHLSEGQEVRVKIIGIDETGRINLSIKKAEEPVASAAPPVRRAPRPPMHTKEPPAPATFEDRLKQFMQESSTRLSGVDMYASSKRPRRRK